MANDPSALAELTQYYYDRNVRRNAPMDTGDRETCPCLDCEAIHAANQRFYDAYGWTRSKIRTVVWCGHVDHYGAPCASPDPGRGIFKDEEKVSPPPIPSGSYGGTWTYLGPTNTWNTY